MDSNSETTVAAALSMILTNQLVIMRSQLRLLEMHDIQASQLLREQEAGTRKFLEVLNAD
jgi:hypothetical protein